MSRPTRRFMFVLAEHLNKTVSEIEQISSEELYEWLAYFNLKNKDLEKERLKQKAQKSQQRTKAKRGV